MDVDVKLAFTLVKTTGHCSTVHGIVPLLVGCLTSQQQASVSRGRICSDNFTCCHTEIEVADPTFYLTQSQYTDTGPTSPSADPITPGAWQDSHWSASFMTRPRKNPGASGIRTRDLPLSRRTPYSLGQRGGPSAQEIFIVLDFLVPTTSTGTMVSKETLELVATLHQKLDKLGHCRVSP